MLSVDGQIILGKSLASMFHLQNGRLPTLLCIPKEGDPYLVLKGCSWAPEGFQPTPPEFPLQEVPSLRICISTIPW